MTNLDSIESTLDLTKAVPHATGEYESLWRTLRDEAPVWWHPPRENRPGFWVVSRYDDAAAVLRDSETFSSQSGNGLSTLLNGGDPAGGMMLAVTDGKRHAAIRQLVMRAFTPRRMREIEAKVAADADRRIESLIDQGEGDFAEYVADQVPLTAICDMFDIPDSDRSELLELTGSALSSRSATDDPDESFAAKNEILFYFSALVEDMQDAQNDSLLSLLIHGEVEGAPLTHQEVVLNCYSLLLAGDESSRLAINGAVKILADHPDQWRALKDGDTQVETAVDEILRWTTPTAHAGRTATEETSLADNKIRAGDVVSVWKVSANRDERRFNDPFTPDLGRSDNKHLSFAHGPHYCLGAFLSRMEIGAVVRSLRSRVSEIAVTGEPSPVYSNFFNGYRTMPVSLRP